MARSSVVAVLFSLSRMNAVRIASIYAERMVLTATLRGLGTLWVAGSWDKAEAAKHNDTNILTVGCSRKPAKE